MGDIVPLFDVGGYRIFVCDEQAGYPPHTDLSI